jgi:hypothetical protein
MLDIDPAEELQMRECDSLGATLGLVQVRPRQDRRGARVRQAVPPAIAFDASQQRATGVPEFVLQLIGMP